MCSTDLFVDVQFPEDLSRIEQVLVLEDPAQGQHTFAPGMCQSPDWCSVLLLLCVPCKQRQVQDQGNPVSIDQEQEGQDGVYGSFRDDVGVETVAEVDWVDVVAVLR